MHSPQVRLTSLAHGGGCGCKLAPSVLQQLLADQPAAPPYKQLLVGTETADDAAVWQVDDEHLHHRHHRLLHADGRRPVRLRPHRRDQRHLRRLCHGRQADHGARHPRHAGRQDPGRDGARDPEGRRGGLRRRPASRSPAAIRSIARSRSMGSRSSAPASRARSAATPTPRPAMR